MQFKPAATLVSLLLVAAIAVASPLEVVDGELSKRACDYSVNCRCQKGHDQGQYCGWCNALKYGSGGVYSNVYECSPEGKCCSYGRRTSCANGDGPCAKESIAH